MDLVLIEGSVCLEDKHSLKELKEARSKSKLLVALGSCAATGGFTVYAKGGQQAQPQHSSFLAIKHCESRSCSAWMSSITRYNKENFTCCNKQ